LMCKCHVITLVPKNIPINKEINNPYQWTPLTNKLPLSVCVKCKLMITKDKNVNRTHGNTIINTLKNWLHKYWPRENRLVTKYNILFLFAVFSLIKALSNVIKIKVAG
jgi:hypothetical protein